MHRRCPPGVLVVIAASWLLATFAVPRTVGAEPTSRDLARIRAAIEREPKKLRLVVDPVIAERRRERAERTAQAAQVPRRDSVWNGLLIGAAIGGVGGYFWARDICGGTDDTECFVISAPVGILAGAGIGAAVGAIADALHR